MSIKKDAKYYPNDNTIADISDVLCAHKHIYDRGNGNKTAYCHYVDGLEIWEFSPECWHGWKLMHKIVSEKEVC